MSDTKRHTKGPLPDSCRGWNWGAFLLNWIWGLGNSTYIGLLCWVPIVNFVMMFVLGAKGNEWAWKNNDWRDEAHFKKTQKKWMIAGIITYIIVGYCFFSGTHHIHKAVVKNPLYIEAKTIVRQTQQTNTLHSSKSDNDNSTQSFNFAGTSITENKDGSGSATFSLNALGSGQNTHIQSALTQKDGEWIIKKLTILTSS